MTATGAQSRIHARLAALAATPASKTAPPEVRSVEELRGEPREKVYRFARLVLTGEMSVKCVVLDLSRSGARVQYDNFGAGLPEFVTLEFEASGISRKARVRWERDHQAGLAFVDPSRRIFGTRARPPVRNRFRPIEEDLATSEADD
jgi:hypothetical protein